jgi:flagellar biogenesis protein FliO
MDLVQQFAGVLIVLGVLAAVLLLGKQRGFAHFRMPVGSGGRSKRMRVEERLALTANHSLHLVAVDGRTILVAVSPGGCQLLDGNAPETRP